MSENEADLALESATLAQKKREVDLALGTVRYSALSVIMKGGKIEQALVESVKRAEKIMLEAVSTNDMRLELEALVVGMLCRAIAWDGHHRKLTSSSGSLTAAHHEKRLAIKS